MRIILTGSSGFLGSIIRDTLSEAGHELITLGRNDAQVRCDLSSDIPVLPVADLVIHAAGKAHMVPKTAEEKAAFHKVNVVGTSNLLKALERSTNLPAFFVFISSVAVYGKESGLDIDESATLGAKDPYGKSKIEAEILVKEWCKINNVICTILRLPLIAGPNPPGNLKAMIQGLKKGYYFNISGGRARKSIVLANDVANIIPRAAEIGGTYNLTDGNHPSFLQLSTEMAEQLGKSRPFNIPGWLAGILAKTGDAIGSKAPINSEKLKKITSDLTFNDSRARTVLGWHPEIVLKKWRVE